jgi:hypothetical protein
MQAVEAKATATWQHETIDFGYRPGVVTLDWLDALAKAMQEEAKASGDDARVDSPAAHMLAGCLVWWDVLDDDTKERLPVTVDFLRRVPMSFHDALLTAIREDNANPPA